MLLAGLVFLMCLPVVNADQQAEIEQFIRQLGSPRFQERVAAGKRLAAIGEPALEPLRRAARSNRDPEIRHRALGAARVVGKLGAVAGNYYLGNGTMRFTLEVDVDGRFAFAWTGCPGFNEHARGSAKLMNGWLVLTPQERRIPKGFTSTPTEFLPVTWGSRTYLLAKHEFLDFCNAINQGQEPRTEPDGFFCLRGGDWTTGVQGMPKLGHEWEKYVLRTPLQGKIIEMCDQRTGRLNFGAKDGVFRGMVVSAGQPGKESYTLRVISIENSSCLVREENELIVPVMKKGDEALSRMKPKKKPSWQCDFVCGGVSGR